MGGGSGAVGGDALLDTLDVADVMAATGWARYTVLEKLRTGEVQSIRLGSGSHVRYRVPRQALVRYLEERLTAPADAPAPRRPRPAGSPVPGRRPAASLDSRPGDPAGAKAARRRPAPRPGGARSKG